MVQASGLAGTSPSSNEVSATLVPLPGVFSLTLVSTGSTQAVISWSASTDAASYTVSYGTSSGSYPTTFTTSGSSPTAITGLTNGTTYYFRVAAINSLGSLFSTNELSATPYGAPTAPTSLVGAASNASVALAWSAPVGSFGAVTYTVKRGTSSGTESVVVCSAVSSTNCTDSTSSNQTTYYYVVTANGVGGTSGNSNEISATPYATAGAPTSLNATAGNSNIALAWIAPAGSFGTLTYTILRGTSSGSETSLATGQSATTYTDLTATNGTLYYYKVQAVGVGGTSASSNEVSATAYLTPGAPTSLAVTPGNATAALAWSAPAGSFGTLTYTVKRGTSTGAESTVICNAVSLASCTDSTPINGTLYYYTVTASGTGGTSSASNEVSTTTYATPVAPTSLAATAGSGSVSLSWTAPVGSFGSLTYTVLRGTSSGGETTLVSGQNTASYTDATPTNGTVYYYKVQAVGVGGTSSTSNEVSATPYTTATAPSSLAATPGNGSVAFTWTAPVGTFGTLTYTVKRGTSSGTESTVVCNAVSSASCTDSTPTNGTLYYYTATASGTGGTSSASNEVSATPYTTPGAPTALAATAGNANIALSWTAPVGTFGTLTYTVKRGTSTGTESTVVCNAVSSLSCTDSTPTNGTTYYYTVTATGTGGTSAASNEVTATPYITPTAPTSLAATPGNASVAMTWTAPSGNFGTLSFTVRRGTSTGTESTVVCNAVATASCTDSTPTNGTLYYYVVSASGSGGTSGSSNEVSTTPYATPTAPTSLAATAGSSKVTLAWTAPVGTFGTMTYTILRSTTSGTETSLVTGQTGTTYTDTAITNGTLYYYEVEAVGVGGTGPVSNESSATPFLGTPTLAWTPLTGAFGSVPISTTSNGITFTLTNSGNGSATSCSAPTLAGANPTVFQIYSDTCGTANLGPSSTCATVVQAIPTVTGAKTATLTRTCTVGGTVSTTANSITVTGTTGGAWAQSSGVFGSISVGNSSSVSTFSYINASGGTLSSCSAPTVSDTTNYTIVSDGCGTSSLTTSSNCLVTIKANPASTGSKAATLSRTCSSVASTLSLTSTGITAVTPSSIVAGENYSCVLLSDQTVQCWGQNNAGQLGDGTSADKAYPVAATGVTGATQIAAGQYHTCALISDKTVKCWGSGTQGQIGIGTTNAINSTPTTVTGLTNVTQIVAGGTFTCALQTTGAIQCWGYNTQGEFGNGSSNGVNSSYVAGASISNVTAIAAGSVHMCAVISGGTVQCWGRGTNGALGNGASNTSYSPVTVSGITTATTNISAGNDTTCVILTGGTVKCWGLGTSGELGNGGTSISNIPVSVSGISTATQLGATTGGGAGYHACALLSSGSISCWGLDNYGQLGDGTTTLATTPVSVAGIATATQVATGLYHACAILSNNTIHCWGNNSNGQIGNGIPFVLTPTTVPGLANVSKIVLGNGFTCALINDGTVKCWGVNLNNQLGDGSAVSKLSPQLVPGLSGVSDLGVSNAGVCAVMSDNTVKCWGSNASGGTGNGTTSSISTPTTISGLTGITLTAGGYVGNFCWIGSGGSMQCAGAGTSGQLGNGTIVSQDTPATVSGLSGVLSMAVGGSVFCAVITGGTVDCWGTGVLGNSAASSTSSTPVQTSVLTNASQVAVSGNVASICALLSTGGVDCWGGNGTGEIANGSSSQLFPVPVAQISTASQIAMGNQHICTLLSAGLVQCWGGNSLGQTGVGFLGSNLSQPYYVYGLSNVKSLWTNGSAVNSHSCAIKNDLSVACWGDNSTYESLPLVLGTSEVSGF